MSLTSSERDPGRRKHASRGSATPASPPTNTQDASFKSKQFRGGWKPTQDYLGDLRVFLGLDPEKVGRYVDFVNQGQVGVPLDDVAFIKKELGIPDDETRSALQNIVGFHIRLFMESPDQVPPFFDDLLAHGSVSKDQRTRLLAIFTRLEPAYGLFTEKNKYKHYMFSDTRTYAGLDSSCKLAVQFKEDFKINGDIKLEDYDAEADFTRVIPVAALSLETEYDGKKEQVSFQASDEQIDNMILVLRATKKQLEMLKKKYGGS